MNHKIKWISDPGHSWLQVSKTWIRELNIANLISNYSYEDDTNVFLEEDCDAAVFIRESHKAGYQINFAEIPELTYNHDAPVRFKKPFCNWR
tara:strand:- start:250 stop:525 length:276 start_codon:yes stop_codon:yes gene_type:complete